MKNTTVNWYIKIKIRNTLASVLINYEFYIKYANKLKQKKLQTEF